MTKKKKKIEFSKKILCNLSFNYLFFSTNAHNKIKNINIKYFTHYINKYI